MPFIVELSPASRRSEHVLWRLRVPVAQFCSYGELKCCNSNSNLHIARSFSSILRRRRHISSQDVQLEVMLEGGDQLLPLFHGEWDSPLPWRPQPDPERWPAFMVVRDFTMWQTRCTRWDSNSVLTWCVVSIDLVAVNCKLPIYSAQLRDFVSAGNTGIAHHGGGRSWPDLDQIESIWLGFRV